MGMHTPILVAVWFGASLLLTPSSASAKVCKGGKIDCNGVCTYPDKCKRPDKKRLRKLKACRKSDDCKRRGICALDKKGNCARTTKKGCSASARCTSRGLCTVAKDRRRCQATLPRHCRNTALCTDKGRCSPRNGLCSVTSDVDCQRSRLCSQDGLCGYTRGHCSAKTVADCRGSEGCRSRGRCELFSGRCATSCTPGRVRTVKSGGRCCFPGQRTERGRCAGKPTRCPAGLVASSTGCNSAPATHRGGAADDEGGGDSAARRARLQRDAKLANKMRRASDVTLAGACKKGLADACRELERRSHAQHKPGDRAAPEGGRRLGGGSEARAGGVVKSAGRAGISWVPLPPGQVYVPKARRKYKVDTFHIARTETSVGQYMKCVRARACKPPKTGSWPPYYAGRHPIVGIDMQQAQAFCKWAGGFLPSDAQWMYAASSAGKTSPYPWGSATAGCDRAVLNNGYDACRKFHVLPGCSKPAGNSLQGVCDLAGNVREWTATGAVRGGGLKSRGSHVRYDSYAIVSKTQGRKDIGFRCASR